MTQPTDRFTIDHADLSKPCEDWKLQLADYGRRRHLSYSLDFDTRVHFLEPAGDDWSPDAKAMHLTNRNLVRESLILTYGASDIETKIQNFRDIRSKPLSVVAYHNEMFESVRNSFIIGAYYPALVGACALGERILNHLILDLRQHYKHTPEFKRVHRKKSFDDWSLAIEVLEAWNVLLPAAASEFQALKTLRHRSIHFNASTYATLREDALTAVLHLREIIDQQFTTFGLRPWFIPGTTGHIFIRRDWESEPFIRTFYLPTCPFVGPNFAISFEDGLKFHDHRDYGDGTWTDEEYARAFNDRDPRHVAPTRYLPVEDASRR